MTVTRVTEAETACEMCVSSVSFVILCVSG